MTITKTIPVYGSIVSWEHLKKTGRVPANLISDDEDWDVDNCAIWAKVNSSISKEDLSRFHPSYLKELCESYGFEDGKEEMSKSSRIEKILQYQKTRQNEIQCYMISHDLVEKYAKKNIIPPESGEYFFIFGVPIDDYVIDDASFKRAKELFESLKDQVPVEATIPGIHLWTDDCGCCS